MELGREIDECDQIILVMSPAFFIRNGVKEGIMFTHDSDSSDATMKLLM